jgi:probable HAF family extracellular repeat protein
VRSRSWGLGRSASGRWEDRAHACVWHDGVVTDLGTLGGNESSAMAINASGTIVGSTQTTDGELRAVLWRDNAIVDLGTLGGRESRATDVNIYDQVVGYAQTSDGDYRPFLWKDGVMRDLTRLVQPPEGWQLSAERVFKTVSVNDAGMIAGTGRLDGQERAFLLEPTFSMGGR